MANHGHSSPPSGFVTATWGHHAVCLRRFAAELSASASATVSATLSPDADALLSCTQVCSGALSLSLGAGIRDPHTQRRRRSGGAAGSGGIVLPYRGPSPSVAVAPWQPPCCQGQGFGGRGRTAARRRAGGSCGHCTGERGGGAGREGTASGGGEGGTTGRTAARLRAGRHGAGEGDGREERYQWWPRPRCCTLPSRTWQQT